MEYFMNTLSYDLKGKTENPFSFPERYPALYYKFEDGIEFSISCQPDIIMESQEYSSSSEIESDGIGEDMAIVKDDLIDQDVVIKDFMEATNA